MFSRIFRTIHRVLGTLLSILFLMWFISGIVMIYHRFPSASQDEKFCKMDVLSLPMPSADTILAVRESKFSPDSVGRMALYKCLGEIYLEVADKQEMERGGRGGFGGRISKFPLDTASAMPQIDGNYIKRVARLWSSSESDTIVKIDTLNKLEQWIPFGRLKEEFPIYKFYFADKAATQVYISSKSGEVLQCTTRSERFWGWMGPIPHWVYFTWLRQDVESWKSVIIWLSIFGIIMLISGCYMAIRSFRLSVKGGRGLASPYKKRWYRWHHIFGTLFGIFVLTWLLSGMYSLAKIPDWLGKEHKKYSTREFYASRVKVADFVLDYRRVIAEFDGRVTHISWEGFGEHPYYKVHLKDGGVEYIDALGNDCSALYIGEKEAVDAVAPAHLGESYSVELMQQYDNYYLDIKGRMELPVWKIAFENADKSVYYINPNNGSVRSFNTHSRWSFQLYQGLHSLRYKIFAERKGLWTFVMWFLLLGGAFVSLTGVVLGIRYLLRLLHLKR